MSVHVTEATTNLWLMLVSFLASFSALELWQLIIDQTQVEFINLNNFAKELSKNSCSFIYNEKEILR